jgi:hypothetical protein
LLRRRGNAAADRQLPSHALRGQVASAIHRAVLERNWGGAANLARLCTYYAHSGLIVLRSVIDPAYELGVGSIRLRVSPDWYWQVGLLDDDVRQGEFHCWIRRDHGGGRQEVIDFTSRYYRQLAETCGLPWDRTDTPPFVWGWLDEVASRHKLQLACDPPRAERLAELLNDEDRRRIEEIAASAMLYFSDTTVLQRIPSPLSAAELDLHPSTPA